MSFNNESNSPSLSAWQAGSLRLTTFPKPTAQFAGQNWWTEIVGEPPEKITSQPRTGEHLQEGLYQNGKLILSVHPIRIEWRWGVAGEISTDQVNWPTLGSFLEAVDQFDGLMSRWLTFETLPPIVRLAFGPVLLQPVESVNKGYESLATYLPFSLDSQGSSDFLYQINRPREAVTLIPNLRINRLGKWAVLQVQLGVISATPILVHQGPSLYACQLELDVNTVAEYEGELPRNRLVELFREMIELAKEIATKGDIP